MKKSGIVTLIIIILIILVGIYWYGHRSPSQTATISTTTQTTTGTTAANIPPTQPVVLTVATSTAIGQYLTAATNDMTLYTYGSDTTGVSNCTGDCASTWPPYTVASPNGIMAISGVTGTVGTITRSDGTYQVTYNGMPLYFYVNDNNPGDMNGAGVGMFSVATP